jgi:hypothetical protein
MIPSQRNESIKNGKELILVYIEASLIFHMNMQNYSKIYK